MLSLACSVYTSDVELQLALNVDGVPLVASSKYCLWPVLCTVMNIAHRDVFVNDD